MAMIGLCCRKWVNVRNQSSRASQPSGVNGTTNTRCLRQPLGTNAATHNPNKPTPTVAEVTAEQHEKQRSLLVRVAPDGRSKALGHRIDDVVPLCESLDVLDVLTGERIARELLPTIGTPPKVTPCKRHQLRGARAMKQTKAGHVLVLSSATWCMGARDWPERGY